MSSGANDLTKAYNLQPFAAMVGDMLHCIQDDYMFL